MADRPTAGGRVMPDFTDLVTRGFVVVPSFLDAAEIDEYRRDFTSQPIDAANRNYGISYAAPKLNARIIPRIREVMAAVAAQTDLRADAPGGAAYFATGGGIDFPWHQDHESYFACQNHYDYLNFYIPVIKPRIDRSNLSVVPFDVLARENPTMCERLVRGGATRFVRIGRRTIVFHDDSGRVDVMGQDLDRLACTPNLAAGDLLLMRGDIIHRTQDAETERVAVSYRVSSAKTVVRRRRLADGGLKKAAMMANNAAFYERMFQAFDVSSRSEMPIGELSRIMATIDLPKARAPRAFWTYLLGQKRRSRVLGRFWPRAALGIAASRCVAAYQRAQRRSQRRETERRSARVNA